MSRKMDTTCLSERCKTQSQKHQNTRARCMPVHLQRVVHVNPWTRRDEQVSWVCGAKPDARDDVQGGEHARLLEGAPVALLCSDTARRLRLTPGLGLCVLRHVRCYCTWLGNDF